jgi:hypothetical protein
VSNSLAVAAVTSAVRYVLERALEAAHAGPVGGAVVTTLRPDALTDTTQVATPGINLYLYDVRPSHAWNLTDLPTRRPDGTLAQRPVAALDLHYLLTCYGDDDSLDAQRLLGRAVLALAVTPVLTRDVVAASVARYGDELEFLPGSDLADQVERVKVAPFALSLEETSRLWGLFQTPHQLSQTYVATAALLEPDLAPRRSLPVRQRAVTVVPTNPPRLQSVRTEPPGAPAVPGTRLVLEGSALAAPPGARTTVRVGAAELEPTTAGALAVEVVLDDTVAAGLQPVRVVHVEPGADGRPPRATATSTVLPLLVRPTVTVRTTGTGTALEVDPPLAPGQRATVALTRLAPGPTDAPAAVTLRLDRLPPDAEPTRELAVDLADVPDGSWLVQVEVDGVESLPELVGETYGAPTLTVP